MKTLSKTRITGYFTLIELIAAMGVFAILMVVVMSIFTAANRAWSNCRGRSEVYENARIAMDLISRDIQCTYYEYGKIPFYHYPGGAGTNDNETLFFVSATSIGSSASYTSKICEIAYSFYNQDDLGAGCKVGWLVRSATADNNPAKWNYYNKLAPTQVFAASDATIPPVYAFTKNSDSKEAYNTVVPNIVTLSFVCLKADGSLINPATTPNMFPYSVIANLTLLDGNSWSKWLAQGGTPSNLATDPAKTFRKQNERKFSKTIIIGERGQKY